MGADPRASAANNTGAHECGQTHTRNVPKLDGATTVDARPDRA